MHGVENRFLEATDELERRAHGGSPDERSLILEEKLQDIAVALFEDPLLAFLAIRACAERQIREIEGLRAVPVGATHQDRFDSDPEISPPVAAYSVEARPEEFFRRERATFEAIKGGLQGHEGRYVVIKGEEVAGVWPSYEEALDGGYDRFGLVTFFVKQLTTTDEHPRNLGRDKPQRNR